LAKLCVQLFVIRKSRFLTAVSPYLANSHRWLKKEEIRVIPNPIELPSEPGNRSSRKSGPVKIGTVINGWQELKNPKAAIRALNLVRGELPGAEMYMYGRGFEQGGLAAKWAESKGLSRNINFCGFLAPHDLQRKLAGMSVLLHPSLEEACPMTVL